ncbi:PKD domain-containing protein [Vulgatibacter sp.]|uniref:PKD domain-containing protein n=1 Tax=Vulgatibacter sp. TaxID=1971226 RepID=UPI003569D70C
MRRCLPLLALLLATACGGGSDETRGGPDVVDGNARPVADAGADLQVLVGEQVVLNGSGSEDREGSVLGYAWSFAGVPEGSTVRFTDGDDRIVNPRFLPDVPGSYVIRLVVDDGVLESKADSVTVVAAALPPDVDAGSDQLAVIGGTVRLDGSASVDPAGGALAWTWRFTEVPEGAAATLEGAATATPSFVPDRAGRWLLELTATTADGGSAADVVAVESYARGTEGRVTPFAWDLVDAEYDRAHDKLVAVSAAPNLLHVIDPSTLEEASLALPKAPLSVSIAPGGATAAVGHDGSLSIVRLAPLALEATHDLAARADEIVLAANGWAYVFPGLGEPDGAWAVELSSGTVHEADGWSIDSGTIARLHPDGLRIYGAENGLSPADIERYGIAEGVLTREYDSPYHGDYPMCGDLWLSEDGARILTACGNVFHASNTRAEDMTYAGSMSVKPLRSADDSLAAGRIATLPVTGGRNQLPNEAVELFDRISLEHAATRPLPPFPGEGRSWSATGRFVFFDAAGGAVLVLVQAEAGSALAADDGIVRFSLGE